jgi:hypothetical protein
VCSERRGIAIKVKVLEMLDFERAIESFRVKEERIKKHLASDKLVRGDPSSEVSQTANIGTDEQKLNRRHVVHVEVAQQTKGLSPSATCRFSRHQ